MVRVTEETTVLVPDGRTPALAAGNTARANDMALTGLTDGGMAVAWTTSPTTVVFGSTERDPDDYGLHVQVLTSNLGKGADTVRLRSEADVRGDVSIAATDGDGFMLTWAEQSPDAGSGPGTVTLRAQTFDARAQAASPVIDLAVAARASELLALGGDRFALILEGTETDQIRVQLLDLVPGIGGAASGIRAAGAPLILGPGSSATGRADLPGGGLAVVWKTPDDGLTLRIVEADGTAGRAIDLGVTGTADAPDVIGLPDGDILVTWHDDDGLSGRRLDGSGAPRAPVFRIGDGGTVEASQNDLTLLPTGDVLVSWEEYVDVPVVGGGTYSREFIVGVVLDPSVPELAAPFRMFRGRDTDIDGHEVVPLANGTLAAVLGSSGRSADSSGLSVAYWNVPTVTLFTPDVAYRGTARDDTIVAGDAPGTLRGYGGDDLLTGGAGDDFLDGGAGRDVLRGGAGDDTLSGGAGYNRLFGEDGNDRIFGGAIRDKVTGGAGNDHVFTAAGNDLAYGQSGDDTLHGGIGADTLVGGDGDDVVSGGSLSDLLFGGDGMDFVNGGTGNDRINLGAGADRVYHAGTVNHGSDWVQDFANDDALVARNGALRSSFQINFADTAGAGEAGVDEAFVIYKPSGQILWVLVDGGDLDRITLRIDAMAYDLLA